MKRWLWNKVGHDSCLCCVSLTLILWPYPSCRPSIMNRCCKTQFGMTRRRGGGGRAFSLMVQRCRAPQLQPVWFCRSLKKNWTLSLRRINSWLTWLSVFVLYTEKWPTYLTSDLWSFTERGWCVLGHEFCERKSHTQVFWRSLEQLVSVTCHHCYMNGF